MPDVVVTVPLTFGWERWIAEGDAAGDQPTGSLYEFSTAGPLPRIAPGERVYVVHAGRLRGYAPLVELRAQPAGPRSWRVSFVRGGGAAAVTIDERVRGFRGWRYRWWSRDEERPFLKWRIP